MEQQREDEENAAIAAAANAAAALADLEDKKEKEKQKKQLDMFSEGDMFAENYQSPSTVQRIASRQQDNPNLTDNWDDAEGYYSKFSLHCTFFLLFFIFF